jgi:hypothetical protein
MRAMRSGPTKFTSLLARGLDRPVGEKATGLAKIFTSSALPARWALF